MVSEGVLFIFQLPAMTVLRYFLFIVFSPSIYASKKSMWIYKFIGLLLEEKLSPKVTDEV